MMQTPIPALLLINDEVVAHFLTVLLGSRSPKTAEAYVQDLEAFALFLAAGSPEAAIKSLLEGGARFANDIALQWKCHMVELEYTAATINRRLATLRAVLRLARTLRLVDFTLDIAGLKVQKYRDTTGTPAPTLRGAKPRDVAIVRLICDVGLRRNEIVELDLADFDAVASTITIRKRSRTATLALTQEAATALAAWISIRGRDSGPLFVALDRSSKGQRLTGNGLWKIVKKLGATPRELRHGAISSRLEASGNDLRDAKEFSRLRDGEAVFNMTHSLSVLPKPPQVHPDPACPCC